MSARSLLQKPRLSRCAAITLLLTACAGPRPATEAKPPIESPSPVPAPGPQAPRASVPKGWVRYVVQPGDTLGRIAACRGVGVEALAEANQIQDPRRLQAGAPLSVPPGDRCARKAAAEANRPLAAPAAASPAIERGRHLLAAARARYDAADFEAALEGARAAARALEPEPGSATDDPLRARCHALAALAAAGLEQRERAISEFRLAFALDPTLELSPDDASPRIQALVAAARQKQSEAAH